VEYTSALKKRFERDGKAEEYEELRWTQGVGHVGGFYDARTKDEYRKRIDEFFGLKRLEDSKTK